MYTVLVTAAAAVVWTVAFVGIVVVVIRRSGEFRLPRPGECWHDE